MAHNLNSMFYVGEKPWHKLGKELDHAATSAEAITAAGLDWKVNKEPIFLKGNVEIPDHFATVRSDTMKPLGIVGDQYKVLQNKEAFSFFDAVVGVKEAMYHTAGSLGDGERVWILAKLPGYIMVKGDDVSEKFLLLVNSHDGTRAAQMMFTPIRVVCQNTLNIAVSSAMAKSSIRHTTNMGNKIDEVRDTLQIVNARFTMFEQAAQKLAATQVTREAWDAYLTTLKLKADSQDTSTARMKNITEEVSRMFESGKGATMVSAKGTAWGAFNAVVEYVDYARGSDKDQTRSKSLLFGSGATLKQRAWNEALKIAGAL